MSDDESLATSLKDDMYWSYAFIQFDIILIYQIYLTCRNVHCVVELSFSLKAVSEFLVVGITQLHQSTNMSSVLNNNNIKQTKTNKHLFSV